MMRSSASLSLVLLFACSDYEFNAAQDEGGGDPETGSFDTSNPDITPVDACSDPTDPAAGNVAINDECEVEYQEGSFTPNIEWNYGTQDYCGPASVGQGIDTNGNGYIDADDTPVVYMTQGNRVHAVYGDSGVMAWQSSGTVGNDFGGMAFGDVNADGWPDIIAASTTSLTALDGRNGAPIWTASNLGNSMDPYGYNYPSIADMNGDGTPEVTVGRTILDGATGAQVGQGSRGMGAAVYYASTGTYGAVSVPIDLDGDGQLELVTGNAAYDMNGNTIWYNGLQDGMPAIADFDGDGQGEIVVSGGARIWGLESDGSLQWEISQEDGVYKSIGVSAIDDIDGDGTPEIVFAIQNNLYAIEWGGDLIWKQTIQDGSGAAGPALFDFEMDGFPEVLYADEVSVRFFNGLDGTLKYSSNQHGSVTILETPVVADVDGDEQVEIVVGHCSFAGIGGITVYGDADGTWPPGRKVWNQHAYHISNVDELGAIPTDGASNFSEYNSFRSADIGLPPSEFYDLRAEILDVCEDECDDGVVYVAARMQNAGNIDAPAGINLALRAGGGGDVVATGVIFSEIPSGSTSEMIVFEVDAADLAGKVPIVVADEDALGSSTIYECDENNNAAAHGSTVCD